MNGQTKEVLEGARRWNVECSEGIEFLCGLPADSCSLVFGSPPYESARTYGIDFKLHGQEWVDWMVEFYRQSRRVCTGLVAFVLEGQTKDYRWSAVPALLMADLHRAGFNLRKPPAFHRVGIPGSGGPDWFRNDYEFIVCTTRGGKLSWSDNTACGHPPKWAPGGEMSNRTVSGTRQNTIGGAMNKRHRDGNGARCGNPQGRRITSGHKNGDTPNSDGYDPPMKANPGNVIHCKVGGGLLGDNYAHENEAPFPEKLVERFVLSFAAPDSVVCDPFSGSGTTCKVAVVNGRRFVGCDIRQSQVELTGRRMSAVTPMMFT